MSAVPYVAHQRRVLSCAYTRKEAPDKFSTESRARGKAEQLVRRRSAPPHWPRHRISKEALSQHRLAGFQDHKGARATHQPADRRQQRARRRRRKSRYAVSDSTSRDQGWYQANASLHEYIRTAHRATKSSLAVSRRGGRALFEHRIQASSKSHRQVRRYRSFCRTRESS